MIKIDWLSQSAAHTRLAKSTSNRRKTNTTFKVDEEGMTGDETVITNENMSILNTTNIIKCLSVLNLKNSYTQTQQVVQYGEALLGELQQIQQYILSGSISYKELKKLEAFFKKPPTVPQYSPPGLEEVISSIQVRVAVELAKRIPG